MISLLKHKFTWKKAALTIVSIGFSFTAVVTVRTINETNNYIKAAATESRIVVEVSPGIYRTFSYLQLDSLIAAGVIEKEDGPNINRKYGGRK